MEGWRHTIVTLRGPDPDPPVTSSNIPAGWQNADINVKLTATDASGVEATYYSVDGSNPTVAYTAPFTISSEGTTTVKYYSRDTRGNVESVHTDTLRLDKTNPVATSDVQSSYITTATIGLSAQDAVSGVLDIAWRLDGGGWQHGASIVATGFGSHNFDYYATDAANNQQPIQHGSFTILQPDSDPPVTGDNIGSGWVQGPYLVELNAYDQISQVQGIYWSTNGATPTVMAAGSTATFTVSAEGPQIVKYYAVDTRGNKEALHTQTLYVDSTPPSTTTDVQASYPTTATIRFTPTDALSGIASTKYKVDSGAWQTGTQVTVGAPGPHTLAYYSIDGAGNTETSKTAILPHQPRHDTAGDERQRPERMGEGPGQRDALGHGCELDCLGDVLLGGRILSVADLLRACLHRARGSDDPQVLLGGRARQRRDGEEQDRSDRQQRARHDE